MVTQGNNRVGNDDIHQGIATVKAVFPNGNDAFGKLKGRQIGEAIERVITDMGYAFLDYDLLDRIFQGGPRLIIAGIGIG